MNFDINKLKECQMVQIAPDGLRNYIGLPILMETLVYVNAYNSKNVVVSRFESEHDFEWVIFDGTIKITPDTSGRIYWTFKELATK